MPVKLLAVLKLSLAASLGLLLAGCWLDSLEGFLTVGEDEPSELFRLVASTEAQTNISYCSTHLVGSQSCAYVVDGVYYTSTVFLSSEEVLFGMLLDPLIAQVPADVTTITATYDVGGGPQPLLVAPVNHFQATPSITVTAEAGQQFVILELPPAAEALVPAGDPANGLPVSYTLAYERAVPMGPPLPPQTIKLLFTGRVQIHGYTYYVPLFPCVTNFAQIPALTLPQSATPQDLVPDLADLLDANPSAPCDDQVYFFGNVPPPLLPEKLYLPILLRGG